MSKGLPEIINEELNNLRLQLEPYNYKFHFKPEIVKAKGRQYKSLVAIKEYIEKKLGPAHKKIMTILRITTPAAWNVHFMCGDENEELQLLDKAVDEFKKIWRSRPLTMRGPSANKDSGPGDKPKFVRPVGGTGENNSPNGRKKGVNGVVSG